MDDQTLLTVAACALILFAGLVVGIFFGSWMERPKRDAKGRFAK